MENLGDGASADGAAALADGELGAFLHGDRVDELDGEGDVVARHDHLGPSREGDGAGDIGGPEEELRTVAVEEVGVAATFLFGEDVGGGGELVMRDDGARLGKDLAALDLVVGDAAEEGADVVAALRVVKGLAEHLEASDDGLLGRADTDDLSFVVDLDHATLDAAGDDGATAGDGHDVFDREKEGLVVVADRIGDVGIEGVKELEDGLAGGIVEAGGVAGLLGGAFDDGDLIARELVLVEEVADVHLDQVDEFGVIDHIGLVEEDEDLRDADLAGKKDVLAGLRHDAVGGADDEDGAVHLGGAGDHVLDVVGVPRAVDVGIMPLLGLVLDVGRVDGDAASPFLRGGVDGGVGHVLGQALHRKDVGDGRGEGGLAVVDVADGPNVEVDAVTVEFFFCHLLFPPKMV